MTNKVPGNLFSGHFETKHTGIFLQLLGRGTNPFNLNGSGKMLTYMVFPLFFFYGFNVFSYIL